jgi:hypothetical protein
VRVGPDWLSLGAGRVHVCLCVCADCWVFGCHCMPTRSLCGIISPVSGGYLIKAYGPSSIGYVPAVLTMLAVFITPMIVSVQAKSE